MRRTARTVQESAAGEKLAQTFPLFTPAKLHQFRGHRPFRSAQRGPQIPRQNGASVDDKSFSRHLIDRPEYLPDWAIPKRIVLLTELELRPDTPVQLGSHGAMVVVGLFREGPGFPAFHPRGEDGDDINPPALHRHVTPDGLEAFPPTQLARSGEVVNGVETKIVG